MEFKIWCTDCTTVMEDKGLYLAHMGEVYRCPKCNKEISFHVFDGETHMNDDWNNPNVGYRTLKKEGGDN